MRKRQFRIRCRVARLECSLQRGDGLAREFHFTASSGVAASAKTPPAIIKHPTWRDSIPHRIEETAH
jgi:hypothetical protein